MTEVDAVEVAKSPEVFSLDKLLSGVAYPIEEVTVFTDAKSVNELIKLMNDRKVLEVDAKKQRTISEDPTDHVAAWPELDDKIEELNDAINKTSLTFTLQGKSPDDVQKINEKHFTEPDKDYTGTEEESARDLELIAASIIKITNGDGSVNSEPVTEATVTKLAKTLLSGEYLKLVRGVVRVSLNGRLFEEATDASFLSRRTNLAG